jgi:hypothetical protein
MQLGGLLPGLREEKQAPKARLSSNDLLPQLFLENVNHYTEVVRKITAGLKGDFVA